MIKLQLCREHDRITPCPLCAATVPPTEADEAAAQFEAEIERDGEAAARFDRLMALLERNQRRTEES